MTDFHQLQGRFTLAPIDARTQQPIYPHEHEHDPLVQATKYELMNPQKQKIYLAKSNVLKQKVTRFKTTKTEVLRVLTENGAVQPVFKTFRGDAGQEMYESTGCRPDVEEKMNEKEQTAFDLLKEEFAENSKAISQLTYKMSLLVGGEDKLLGAKRRRGRAKRSKTDGEDTSVETIIEEHSGDVINLGDKVAVFCKVAKSMGHIKHNFVRNGKVIYFDAGKQTRVLKFETITNLLPHTFKGDIHDQIEWAIDNCFIDEAKVNVTTRRALNAALRLHFLNHDWSEKEWSQVPRDLRGQIYDEQMTSKFKRRKRNWDNTYGVLYEDNESEFGVSQARLTQTVPRSLRSSLSEMEMKTQISLPVKKKEKKIVMETVRQKHEDMKEKEKQRVLQKRKAKSILEEKRRVFMEKKAAEEQKREDLMREKEKKMREKEKAKEKQNEIPIPAAVADLKPVTQLTKEEIQEERQKKEKRFKANQKKAKEAREREELNREKQFQRAMDIEAQVKKKEQDKIEALVMKNEKHAKKIEERNKARDRRRSEEKIKYEMGRAQAATNAAGSYMKSLNRKRGAAQTEMTEQRARLTMKLEEAKTLSAKLAAFPKTKDNPNVMRNIDLKEKRKVRNLCEEAFRELLQDLAFLKDDIHVYEMAVAYSKFYEAFNVTIADKIEKDEQEKLSAEKHPPTWKSKKISEELERLWEEMDSMNVKSLKRVARVLKRGSVPTKAEFWSKEFLEEMELEAYTKAQDRYKEASDEIKNFDLKKSNVVPIPQLRKDFILQNVFNLIDHDQNGISAEELVEGLQNPGIRKELKKSIQLRALDETLTGGDHELFFALIDRDHSNKLDFAEFFDFAKKVNGSKLHEICEICFEELQENNLLDFHTFQHSRNSNKRIQKALSESNSVKHILGTTVFQSATEEIIRRGILTNEGYLTKMQFVVFLKISQEHADKDYIVYYDSFEGEEVRKASLNKVAKTIVDEISSGVISETDFRHEFEYHLFVNVKIHDAVKEHKSARHMLNAYVLKTAQEEAEDMHLFGGKCTIDVLKTFLSIVHDHAIAFRVHHKIYGVANNIKDWKKLQQAVAQKQKKITVGGDDGRAKSPVLQGTLAAPPKVPIVKVHTKLAPRAKTKKNITDLKNAEKTETIKLQREEKEKIKKLVKKKVSKADLRKEALKRALGQ